MAVSKRFRSFRAWAEKQEEGNVSWANIFPAMFSLREALEMSKSTRCKIKTSNFLRGDYVCFRILSEGVVSSFSKGAQNLKSPFLPSGRKMPPQKRVRSAHSHLLRT